MSKTIKMHLTDEEAETIELEAKELGLSRNMYIKYRLRVKQKTRARLKNKMYGNAPGGTE